jgi:hypothetical protein
MNVVEDIPHNEEFSCNINMIKLPASILFSYGRYGEKTEFHQGVQGAVS